MHLCSFSTGIADLTWKQQADISTVLGVIQRDGRFSCFDASDNATIAHTMTTIEQGGFIVRDEARSQYPWIYCSLTDKGRHAVEGEFLHGPEEDPMKGWVCVGNHYVAEAVYARLQQEVKK